MHNKIKKKKNNKIGKKQGKIKFLKSMEEHKIIDMKKIFIRK